MLYANVTITAVVCVEMVGLLSGEGYLVRYELRRVPPTCARNEALARLAADEREQAVVILAAGGAADKMGTQARDRRVGISAGDFELDVAVKFFETDIAADLGLDGPQQTSQCPLDLEVLGHSSSSQSLSAKPRSTRCARSLRRASCNVL